MTGIRRTVLRLVILVWVTILVGSAGAAELRPPLQIDPAAQTRGATTTSRMSLGQDTVLFAGRGANRHVLHNARVSVSSLSEAAYGYDDAENLVRASARPSAYGFAPNTTGLIDDAVRINRHHTVPLEILRQLPDDVASHPLVRGRAGAPNRWAISEDVHRGIHAGPGGGAYNQAWFDELANLGRAPTVDDILRLREQITKQFGIDIYRLGSGGGL